MKYLFILLFLVSLSRSAFGQEKSLPERLMTQHQITHQDIQLNCVSLIPGLYAAGKDDTLNQLLSYWREQCGDNALYLAFVFIREIRERRFTERLFPNANIVQKLRNYIPPSQRPYYYFSGDRSRDFNTPGDSAYRFFVAGLAGEALHIPDLDATERFLAEFYADPAEARLETLRDEKFKGTVLRRDFGLTIAEEPRPHRPPDISVCGGLWIPAGNLAVLGHHPYFGLAAGSIGRRWSFGASVLARFNKSPESRLVRSDDSLFSAKHFFGLNVTGNAAYAIAAKARHRLELLGGAGFEGVDVLMVRGVDRTETRYSRSLISLDMNAGLGYRFRLSAKHYLGLQAKYHVLNFCNTGGTDLNGDACSIGAVFGFNGAF